MNAIPLVDLRRQRESIRAEVDAAIARVLDGGQFILGPEVKAFEAEFAAYCEAGSAVGVSSGLDALKCALWAVGVGPGDEVIVPANTYIATALAVSALGATVRLVDCEDRFCNIDLDAVERAIGPRTKVLLPVHLYGHPADMDPLLALAARRGLTVIEDAAQAHGARCNGRRVGAIGKIGCFSFYPGKNLGAYGDGGAVVTNDSGLAARIRMYRDYGQEEKHRHALLGQNHRLDEIQAAILRVKLRHLDAWNARRREVAARYALLLANSGLRLPEAAPWAEHVYHLYVVRHARRDDLLAALAKERIFAGLHYPRPIHLQPAYGGLGHRPGAFPNAEAQATTVLSLPMFAELTDGESNRIAGVLAAELAADSGRT